MENHDPELISLYIDGELEPAERARVEAHLASCEACRRTRDAFAAVGARVRAAAAPADRLAARRALREILASGPEPFWRRRVAVPAPALATLVAALLVTVVLLVTGRRAPSAAPPPPAAAPATAEGLDPSRFDRGNRMEVYVARHGRGEVTP
jgi:anti-sigma factor RsiW